MTNAITVDWLHEIAPDGWQCERRGISFANWTIHSIIENGNYDDGPFIWTVMPSHGQNMIPLERRPSGGRFFAILVMEDRKDVQVLLNLLTRKQKAKRPHDWCADTNCPTCNRRRAAEEQSYGDLAASGGIVDAP